MNSCRQIKQLKRVNDWLLKVKEYLDGLPNPPPSNSSATSKEYVDTQNKRGKDNITTQIQQKIQQQFLPRLQTNLFNILPETMFNEYVSKYCTSKYNIKFDKLNSNILDYNTTIRKLVRFMTKHRLVQMQHKQLLIFNLQFVLKKIKFIIVIILLLVVLKKWLVI